MGDEGPLTCGRRVLTRVWSPQLQNERDVDIFLPPTYARTRWRYPVVYMHDGQNLADPHRAFAGTWELPRALCELARRGREAIVVGIPNSGAERLREYSPFPDERLGTGRGDAYVAFIERTLKPLVDKRVRTMPAREFTGIFGSSMGGLISLYSFFRAPDTFGFVGAMSPSLWVGDRAITAYIEQGGRPSGRVYVDVGTEEGTGTVGDVRQLAEVLERRGYVPGESMLFSTAQGGRHQEAHWADRLVPALEFLLPIVARRRRTTVSREVPGAQRLPAGRKRS